MARRLRGVGVAKNGIGEGFTPLLSLYGPVSIVGAHTCTHTRAHT
jgi:hypothetical protein